MGKGYLAGMASEKTSETAPFAALRDAQYIRLTTFRKSGAGVAMPVWFAQVGDTLYITTLAQAGKVKRIRANPRVLVAPCDARGVTSGPAVEAHARLLAPEEFERAEAALKAKYGMQYRMIRLLGRVRRGQVVAHTYLAISPAA